MLEVCEEVNGLISKEWDQLLVLDPNILSHLSTSEIENVV